MKLCSRCNIEKLSTEFYTRKARGKIYLRDECKICARAISAKSRAGYNQLRSLNRQRERTAKTITTANQIPYNKLAMWLGWRWYRRFALEHKADFQQIAATLAWESLHLSEIEARRTIMRGFQAAMGDYGYRYTQQDGRFYWLPAEAVPLKTESSHGRKLVTCDFCGEWFSRQAHKVKRKGRNQVFCSPPCYRSFRRASSAQRAQSAKITCEAIRRFQQRVANLPESAVVAAIQAGVRSPVKTVSRGLKHGIELHCEATGVAFRCRCRERAGRLEICTVLESQARNDQMRERRKTQRAGSVSA